MGSFTFDMQRKCIVIVVVMLTSNEFRLLISKMNRIDEKLDQLSRKISIIMNRSGNGSGGHRDVPTVPDGMKLPADTVKDLKTVASILQQNDRTGKSLVSVCLYTLCACKNTHSVNVFLNNTNRFCFWLPFFM